MTRKDPSGWEVRWDQERARVLVARGAWANLTMAHHAAALVDRAPDRIIVIDGERGFSAAEIYQSARRLADALVDRGLRPGDRISFQLPNWYEVMIIDLAATMAGLIANPLVPIFREAEVGFMAGEMESRIIFIPAEFRGYDHRAMMRRVLDKTGITPEVVVVRGDPGEFTAFDALVASGSGTGPLPTLSPDDVKLALYTSGTTGRAKAVLHSHNTVGSMAGQFLGYMGVTENDTMLVASPVTHIAGAILAFQLPWIVGARAVLIDIWDGDRAQRLVRDHQVTISNGAAPFLIDILAAADQGDAMPSLRLFIAGGSAIPASLMREAYDKLKNCVLFRAYGATEVPTATLGSMDRADIELNISTDGRPVATELKIVDPTTGQAVAHGQEGEFLMRGAQSMLGYLRPEDNAAAFDAEGFFRSGDLGRFVVDDWIEVSGRSKDIIIRAGENISPKEIEDALLDHPDITTVSIVAKPSARTGEAACAFVIPAAGKAPTLADISRFLISNGFAKQKIPEHLVIVDTLPMTPAGKVQKHLLRELAKTVA